MNKLFGWLSGLIPEDYSVGVAVKKVSYMAGKLAAGYIAGKLAAGHVTPDQANQIQLGITTAVAGGLEAIHDWAKMKWPGVKWL